MSEKKSKTTTKKTAFQNDKAAKAEELKKKRGRPKKTAGAKSSAGAKGTGANQGGGAQAGADPGGIDPRMCQQEAAMFLDTIDALRRSAGITKAIPENQKAMFAQSYYQISLKYGANMAKYMPEMMFGLSAGLILLDTFKEFKIIRDAQRAEKKRQETADRRDTPRSTPAAEPKKQTKTNTETNKAPDLETATYVPPAKPMKTERPFVIDGGETPTQ